MLVVAALVVIGLVATAGPGTQRAATAKSGAVPVVHTISLPASAAGYHRLTGNVAQRLVTESRQRAIRAAGTVSSAWARAYQRAKIGIYQHGQQRLIFMGFSTADSPQLAVILRQPPSTSLDSFFLGAGVANTHDFPAGPLGGVLRCGVAVKAGTQVGVCAWTDSSTLGVTFEPGVQLPELAHATLAVRAAGEH